MAAAVIGLWTFSHGRELPFPRHHPMEPHAHGFAPLIRAPLNAPIPLDTQIWAMLRLPLPVRETFARELDAPRPGLLTRLNQLASLVIAVRTAVVSVGCCRAMDWLEQQEALHPLPGLGQRLRPIFLQMVVAEGLPTNFSVGDREFRWAQRAVRLFAHTVQLAANASAPPWSFTR
jgi:hypothetical protein